MPTTTVAVTPGSPTATAVASAHAAGDDTAEREIVTDAIGAVLATHPDGGLVDSYALADVLFDRRCAADREPDWTQTKDYTQHLLREAAHVCRHADGHHYRVHADERCGDSCDTRWAQVRPTARRESCPECFLELTTAGACPMGCA